MKNQIADKSFKFSVKVILLCKQLIENKEYVLSRQLIKSASSIGANVEEAIAAASKKDFLHKLSIAHKEARETKYWIRLLYYTEYISFESYHAFYSECDEIIRILFSITNTLKEQLNHK